MNVKPAALILALITLCLGFAAGSFFSPMASRSSAPETAAPEISPTATVNSVGSASEIGHPAQRTLTARPTPTLDSIANDTSAGYYSYQRTKDIITYADSLSPAEIGDAVRKVEKMQNSMAKYQLRYFLVMRWSEADPQGALAWSQAKGGGQFEHFMKQQTVQMAFKGLAAQDVSGALAQAQQLPAGQKRDQAVTAIAGKIAETDPAQALQMVQGIKNTGAMDQIFSKWAEKDPAQATQAAMSQLTNVRDRVEAMDGIARKLVSKDPQAAIAWARNCLRGKYATRPKPRSPRAGRKLIRRRR